MMEYLNDKMRQESLRAMRRFAQPRIGRVTSYDPNTHRAKVVMLPEADDPTNTDTAETDWLPIGTPLVGNGWGVYAGPSPGERVMVVHQEGSYGAGVIVGRLNNADTAPPPAVPSGEVWAVHSSQNYIKLQNDKSVRMHHYHGNDVLLLDDDSMRVNHHLGNNVVLGGDDTIIATHHTGSHITMAADSSIQLVHKSGSSVVLAADGSVTMQGGGAALTILADGNVRFTHSSGASLRFLMDGRVHINGDLMVNGNIYDNVASLAALRGYVDTHVHIDGGGTGNSGPPYEVPIYFGNPDPNAGNMG